MSLPLVGPSVEFLVVSRLIHLNGPPGIGKSTLARRYADDHPGTLNCDIDVLRTFIGGWASDFAGAGALIRPAALALIGAYLREGQDVVMPQMLTDLKELDRFEASATAAGARFVEVMLMDELESVVSRFHGRGASEPEDLWHDHVREIVAASGGDSVLVQCHAALERLVTARPDAVVVRSEVGTVEETYAMVLASAELA